MGSEMVKFDGSMYPALVPEHREAIMLAVRENIGDSQIRPLDLDRITVPAGGGLFWLVKSLDNPDGVPTKELNGIVVYQRRGRSYWKQGLGEGAAGSPPDCSSDDAIFGIGDPGGVCDACAMAQFGSDPKGGKSQACAEKRMLFLLRPGSALPTVVMVPPSSLGNLKTFMLRLASEGVPYYAIEIGIGLEKAKNKEGIEFSRVTFSPRARITGEQISQIKDFAETMKDVFASVPVSEAAEIK